MQYAEDEIDRAFVLFMDNDERVFDVFEQFVRDHETNLPTAHA